MKKKLITYLAILTICLIFFPYVGSKLIVKYKFPLKTNDLSGLEELTNKVFTFTNKNFSQKMPRQSMKKASMKKSAMKKSSSTTTTEKKATLRQSID